MGVGTLNDRAAGQTILDTFFNDIHGALDGDFVGRNASGVATAGQNLGTVSIPWGSIRADTLILDGAAVDTSQITRPQNVVTSGVTRATSNQPAFIVPNGAALSFVVDGTPTNLVIDINGSSVTVSTDITKSSLTAAPSSNNTALVDDAAAADQQDTRLWGEPEHRKAITIDTIGSEITALNGKIAAFMLDNGSSTEYFLAHVDTTNNRLIQCRRGFFYTSTLAPKNRIFFSNNDTITLLKLGWIFIENNATTVDVTYTNPVWSFESPSSPATGDYWYDLANETWKRYDGASFQIINRTLVGMFCNTSAACVGARCIDFFANHRETNTVDVTLSTTEIVQATKHYKEVMVAGNLIQFNYSRPTWNITTDLAGSSDMYDATEQASRMYYLYLKDTGDTVISDISPYYRDDILGAYHPHNPWRMIGMAYNNGSSNLTVANGFSADSPPEVRIYGGTGYGSTNNFVRIFSTTEVNNSATLLYITSATAGDSWTCFAPCKFGATYVETRDSGTMDPGIALNPTTLGASAFNDTSAIFGFGVTAAATVPGICSGTANLKIGDVLYCGDFNSAGGLTTGGSGVKSTFTVLKYNFV